MNIQPVYTAVKPRHIVWCLSSDLTAGADGSYTFKDTSVAVGDGSEIFVMDTPGLILYWSEDDQKAYDWVTTGG